MPASTIAFLVVIGAGVACVLALAAFHLLCEWVYAREEARG